MKSVSSILKTMKMDLQNPKNRNRWIVGTPPDVPTKSDFYSDRIQIAYVKNPERKRFASFQTEHWHTPPIEEYILVIQGALKLRIEDKVTVVKPQQLLKIPPKIPHKIIDCTSPLQYFLIRAPISTEKTKVNTE